MELLKLSKDISCVYTDWEMYYLHPASTHFCLQNYLYSSWHRFKKGPENIPLRFWSVLT